MYGAGVDTVRRYDDENTWLIGILPDCRFYHKLSLCHGAPPRMARIDTKGDGGGSGSRPLAYYGGYLQARDLQCGLERVAPLESTSSTR